MRDGSAGPWFDNDEIERFEERYEPITQVGMLENLPSK